MGGDGTFFPGASTLTESFWLSPSTSISIIVFLSAVFIQLRPESREGGQLRSTELDTLKTQEWISFPLPSLACIRGLTRPDLAVGEQ